MKTSSKSGLRTLIKNMTNSTDVSKDRAIVALSEYLNRDPPQSVDEIEQRCYEDWATIVMLDRLSCGRDDLDPINDMEWFCIILTGLAHEFDVSHNGINPFSIAYDAIEYVLASLTFPNEEDICFE